MATSTHFTLWLVCFCSLPAATAASQLQRQDLLQDLLITAQAHQRLVEEFRVLGSKGTLNGRERQDFEDYLNNLARRVATKCSTLFTLYPDVEGKDLPCVAAPPSLAPVVDVAAERTASDKVAELDVALLEGLGDFDEMLLREQQEIAARTPRARAASGGGVQGSAYSDSGEAAGGAQAREEGQQSGDANPPTDGSREAGPMPRGTGQRERSRGGLPSDVARSRSEDDVVARQLREAAESEQDPELKEKLWEEYRRYKAATGQQGKR